MYKNELIFYNSLNNRFIYWKCIFFFFRFFRESLKLGWIIKYFVNLIICVIDYYRYYYRQLQWIDNQVSYVFTNLSTYNLFPDPKYVQNLNSSIDGFSITLNSSCPSSFSLEVSITCSISWKESKLFFAFVSLEF